MELKRIKTICHYHLTKRLRLKNGLICSRPNQSARADSMRFSSTQLFLYFRHVHVQGTSRASILILTSTHLIHKRGSLVLMHFMEISRFVWSLFCLIFAWLYRWIRQLLNVLFGFFGHLYYQRVSERTTTVVCIRYICYRYDYSSPSCY